MELSRRMRRLGWLCFALMWLPFAGIFVGLAGMPDGSYSWPELPMLARISILGTGAFGAVAVLLLIGSPVLSSIQNRSILANGQPADATIVDIQPTGATINNYYVGLSVLLDVKPLSEPTFQARAEKFVPMHLMAKYQAGAAIRIKFDPHSRAVAIMD